MLFAILEYEGVITGYDKYDAPTVETQMQDFVVTIEMVFAALAHHFYFSYKDFYDSTAPLIIAPMFRSMFEVVNVSDVFVQDVNSIRQKHSQRKKKRQQHKDSRRNSQEIPHGLSEALLAEEGSGGGVGGDGGGEGEGGEGQLDEQEQLHGRDVSVVVEEDEEDEKHHSYIQQA